MMPWSDIAQAFGLAAAPLATIAVAFFTYLSSKNNRKEQQMQSKDTEIKELKAEKEKSRKDYQKELYDIQEKYDESEARQDSMLQYIYAMRRRDYQEGRDPLPLPDAISLRS